MKTIILALLISQTAQANWCTKLFSKIAVDDPYQYEQVQTDALVLYYEQFGIKGAWNRLEERDAMTMNIIGAELRWRLGPVMVQFQTPQNIERINTALETYQQFEGEAVITKDKKK